MIDFDSTTTSPSYAYTLTCRHRRRTSRTSSSTAGPVHHHHPNLLHLIRSDPIRAADSSYSKLIIIRLYMEQLPDDMLADVLGRLPPSSLAASRCVRKHWCSIIDARRLLRVDLLPLRLDAFYCTCLDCFEQLTYLFARPASAARRIPGGCLDFLEHYMILEVEDHCNGLLLLYDMVVNPATRQWANLPTSPEPSIDDMLGGLRVWAGTATDQDQEKDNHHLLDSSFYLVYDPMVESAQHFEVFLIPSLAHGLANRESITIDIEEQEWPPSTFRTHVFSSRRWRWEERS
ncbi:hypothetical protein BDA96_10G196500 [Sorghum bicolor]|uniref:F-box domain-containing protein n=1 Tax=Sorghum bicolor TaxID=4558 RepID=A0A921Q5E6_SORBI|nr:hypothetical protein BDA96_10G196500 [Sorghum bicolor]